MVDDAGRKNLALGGDGSRKGLWFLTKLVPLSASLSSIGGALAWLIFNRPRLEDEDGITNALRWVVCGNEGCRFAMHRGRDKRHRSLLPFSLGGFTSVCTWQAKLVLKPSWSVVPTPSSLWKSGQPSA